MCVLYYRMIKEPPCFVSISQDVWFSEPNQIISSITCKYRYHQDYFFKGPQPENVLTNLGSRRLKLFLLIALEYSGWENNLFKNYFNFWYYFFYFNFVSSRKLRWGRSSLVCPLRRPPCTRNVFL
jgi:hypothetical protein